MRSGDAGTMLGNVGTFCLVQTGRPFLRCPDAGETSGLTADGLLPEWESLYGADQCHFPGPVSLLLLDLVEVA